VNTGSIVIDVAFGAAGAALVAYLLAWSGASAARRPARALYYLMTLCLLAASILLMGAILSDDFSIRYVSNYSSRELPLLYKISAFWGGQEGTFLLWGLFQALAGFAILRRGDAWEKPVLSFLLLAQVLLLAPLLMLRPFQTIAAPADGAGLNPLLQDPWMAIHPPIVFIGYAALVVPFAFALAALASKKTAEWHGRALPWVLFSILSLGLGLFLGGFWAYKVLGWGGYWGWDPVENSSLAPWLVAAALLHGLLIQRATGGLRRTNATLAAVSYLLVLYATFMTRSGVLSKFSVHSFGDSGVGTPLLVAMVALLLASGGLLLARFRSLQSPPLPWKLSLSSALAAGLVVLLAGAALLVVGTSWPILSGLAGAPASPGPGFYNATSLPLGIFLAAILIAAPLMTWAPSRGRELLRQVAPGLAAGMVAAAIPFFLGLSPKGGIPVLVLLGAATAALVASLTRVSRQIRRAPMSTGAGISHAGLALMLIGIVVSSAFDRMESVRLQAGRPGKVLGHEITFRRYVSGLGSGSHLELDVVPASGPAFVASPILFRDEKRDTVIARPHIERALLGDVYISPVGHEPAREAASALALVKNTPQDWGPYTLTFRRFETHFQDAGSMSVGALVDVSRDGKTEPMSLVLRMGEGGAESAVTPIPMSEGGTARLEGMQVENGTIRVGLEDPSAAGGIETAVVDVSTKPMVNALWLGILLVGGGSALSALQRTREERLLRQATEETVAPARTKRPRSVTADVVTVRRRAVER